jgi:hypothetical protein
MDGDFKVTLRPRRMSHPFFERHRARRYVGRFLISFSRILWMPAKGEVKKDRFAESDRLRRLSHRDYRERKARRAAETAINAFDTVMGQVRDLRRWQDMIREMPNWRPWHTHHDRYRRIFSPSSKVFDRFLHPSKFPWATT